MNNNKYILHKELAAGKWFKYSLVEQLANVGVDIERCIKWKNQGDLQASKAAFERALDLLYITVEDAKNKHRLREVLRMREALIDHFVYDNEYNTTDEQWQKYFYQLNYAAAMQKGR